MDALRERMGLNQFLDFFNAFVDKLGNECVDDPQLVTEADLPLVGMKPVQVRRFVRIDSAPSLTLQQSPTLLALPAASPASSAPSIRGPAHTHEREMGPTSIGPSTANGTTTSSAQPGDGSDYDMVHHGDHGDDHHHDHGPSYDVDVQPVPAPPQKRRNLNRLSFPQRGY